MKSTLTEPTMNTLPMATDFILPRMDEASITRYITDTFDETNVVEADGNFFYLQGSDQMFPFATLMTNDVNDQFSNLDRPSVFRLNVGVAKATYQSLFGPAPKRAEGPVDGATHDFTALDQLLPHPVYGRQYWVCVINPSAATFETVKPLLAEAYGIAVNRNTRRAARA
jgi:hypothetical protein